MRVTRSSGFSLVEVLVATAVLTVGVLGAASLLLSSLRQQRQALDQAAASALVTDAANRLSASLHVGFDAAASPAPSPASCVLGCEAAALASHDLAYFAAAARARFPHGEPEVSIIFEPATGPATPGRYLLSLRWRMQDESTTQEVPLTVLAQLPVAG